MKPIEFDKCNSTWAEYTPKYQNLPAFVASDGVVVTCWQLTWKERLKLLFTGRVWHSTLTFGKPLQPLILDVDSPLEGE